MARVLAHRKRWGWPSIERHRQPLRRVRNAKPYPSARERMAMPSERLALTRQREVLRIDARGPNRPALLQQGQEGRLVMGTESPADADVAQ